MGHERPDIDNHSSVLTEIGQTAKKIISIHLALENLSSINVPAHNIWNAPGASRTPFRFRQDQRMVLPFSLVYPDSPGSVSLKKAIPGPEGFAS